MAFKERDHRERIDGSRRLSRALKAANGCGALLLSREVCEAVSGFLGVLREADARADGGPRFTRDDGVILLKAKSQTSERFELLGYVRWISQQVDPVWARVEVEPDEDAVKEYVIKCGVRRLGDGGYAPEGPGLRHLRKVLLSPTVEDVEKAWFSGQLSHDADIWFFEFRSPGG